MTPYVLLLQMALTKASSPRLFSGDLDGSIFKVLFPSLAILLVLDRALGIDRRNIPALGRIGDPDDILGSVMVEGGKVCLDACVFLLDACRLLICATDPPRNLPKDALV